MEEGRKVNITEFNNVAKVRKKGRKEGRKRRKRRKRRKVNSGR